MRAAENHWDEDVEGFVPPWKKKRRKPVIHLEEKPVLHLDVDTSSEAGDDGADSLLHNARSEWRRTGMRESPDPNHGELKKYEVGESSRHGLSNLAYDLEPKMLAQQAFDTILDFAALTG